MGSYSRKCFHGVPKIIQKTFLKTLPVNDELISIPNSNQNVLNFLKEYRINMNLR